METVDSESNYITPPSSPARATIAPPVPSGEVRDWRADLVLCEAATPGPWEASCWPEPSSRTTLTPAGHYGRLNGPVNTHGEIIALGIDMLFCAAARAGWPAALHELLRLQAAIINQSHEIEQTLGKALGYPWYKDDPANFPGATEADGVCVGDHVAESLATEAANRIRRKETEAAFFRAEIEMLESALAEKELALAAAHALLKPCNTCNRIPSYCRCGQGAGAGK